MNPLQERLDNILSTLKEKPKGGKGPKLQTDEQKARLANLKQAREAKKLALEEKRERELRKGTGPSKQAILEKIQNQETTLQKLQAAEEERLKRREEKQKQKEEMMAKAKQEEEVKKDVKKEEVKKMSHTELHVDMKKKELLKKLIKT